MNEASKRVFRLTHSIGVLNPIVQLSIGYSQENDLGPRPSLTY